MKDTKMQPAKDAVIEELRKVIVDCYWPTSPVAINEILDRLEAAEKERDQFKSNWLECLTLAEEAKPIIDRQRSEIDALRAKIEAMERQGPGFRERCTPSAPTGCSNRFPLYALPGAQGEEK